MDDADPGTRETRQETRHERRPNLVLGLILILLGGAFLVARQLDLDLLDVGWPLFVIGPGIALLLGAFAVGGAAGSGLAIAGGITTATGLLLAWQNATGLWSTWAYAWALVAPGGAGLGLLLYGTLTRQAELAVAGRWMVLVGAALFAGFGLFFEGVVGLSGGRLINFDTALPVILVVVGGAIVLFSLVDRGRGRT